MQPKSLTGYFSRLKTSDFFKYFKNSLIFSLSCLVIGMGYSFYKTGSLAGSLSLLFLILVLALLEISLSFDNAIVNAKQLESMTEIWRKRFLTWGIAIAVFGMRFFIPLALVAMISSLSLLDSLVLAFKDPVQYGSILESSDILVSAFGGSFLLLVALNFFLDSEKEHHWFDVIEKQLAKVGSLQAVSLLVTLVVGAVMQGFLPEEVRLDFLTWYLYGIFTHEAIGIFHHLTAGEEDTKLTTTATVARQGFVGFLYLEILDISFSLDGVIGSLAMSSDIIIIMLGLSIGAFFVRSLTIYMLEKKVLKSFQYIEHGAFYSILTLSAAMLVGLFLHIPELLTGVLAIATLGLAIFSSTKQKA